MDNNNLNPETNNPSPNPSTQPPQPGAPQSLGSLQVDSVTPANGHLTITPDPDLAAELANLPAAPSPATHSPSAVVAASPTPSGTSGGSFGSSPTPSEPGASFNDSYFKRNKSPLIAALIAFLVVFSTTGFYFLYYMPNLPENVWNAGLANVGKGFGRLDSVLNDPNAFKKLQKSELTASGELKSSTSSSKMSMTTDFDASNSNTKLTLSGSSSSGGESWSSETEIKTRSNSKATFPDTYVKTTNVDMLPFFSYMLAGYDNKWISITQSDLKKMGIDLGSTDSNKETILQADIANLSHALTPIINKYVFTGDKKTAILQLKEFVSDDKEDGHSLYKYNATISPENVNSFCIDASNAILSSEVYRKSTSAQPSEIDKLKGNVSKDCETITKDVDSKKTYSIWMDKGTRTFYKIRLGGDEQNPNTYVDVGQKIDVWAGTSTVFVNAFVKNADNDSFFKYDIEVDVAVSLNFKSMEMAAKAVYKDKATSSNSGSMDMKLVPLTKDVETSVPSGATSIYDIETAYQKSLAARYSNYDYYDYTTKSTIDMLSNNVMQSLQLKKF